MSNSRITFEFEALVNKNSYQRNLVHRSIIDYTQIHFNRSELECIRDSATPHSFVEVGAGNDKIIIGSPDMIPPPIRLGIAINVKHARRE
jgi:hypothetical protein